MGKRPEIMKLKNRPPEGDDGGADHAKRRRVTALPQSGLGRSAEIARAPEGGPPEGQGVLAGSELVGADVVARPTVGINQRPSNQVDVGRADDAPASRGESLFGSSDVVREIADRSIPQCDQEAIEGLDPNDLADQVLRGVSQVLLTCPSSFRAPRFGAVVLIVCSFLSCLPLVAGPPRRWCI
ncbi:hypothetical protein U1Q18_052552 [Sarracenia purpurea var. burkii]